MIIKITSIILPLILVIIFSILTELIVKYFGKTWITYSTLPILGIILSAITYLVFKKLSDYQNLQVMNLGSGIGFVGGMILGLIVSCTVAYLFYLIKAPKYNISLISKDIHLRMLANVFPALVEEITFRGGIVHFLTTFWGKTVGLIGGSVPFGIIHFVGRIFGHPVDFFHVVGVSMAGLTLSVLYLEFGLLPAVGFHWTWNFLCPQWVKVFNLPQKGGVQLLEGHWITSTVLLIVVIALLIIKKIVWTPLK